MTKSYSFYVDNITELKFQEIKSKAEVALQCKNHISQLFYLDLLNHLNMSNLCAAISNGTHYVKGKKVIK